MKITIIKTKGTKETMTRMELADVINEIVNGEHIAEVHRLRELYPLIRTARTEDGRIRSDFDLKLTLPRLCFSTEMQQLKGERKTLVYNGLLVLEANNLADYDEAIMIRDKAARLPQTL